MTPQIMIVEDEFLIAMEMEQIVGNLGYNCIGVADDTESAIQLVLKKPDIALVDVNLSDGPTGPEIGARLAKDYDVKVVFQAAGEWREGHAWRVDQASGDRGVERHAGLSGESGKQKG